MRKLKYVFSAMAWLMAMPMMAEVGDEFTSGNLKFKVVTENETTKEVQVIRPDANLSGDVVIPDHVTNNAVEYSVAYIKGGEISQGCAFREMNDITSVTIPYTVYSMEYSAFYHCEGLQTVYNNGNMDKIDGWTFNGCTSLESCTIPSTIKNIGESAFEGCTSLDNIVFPSSLENLGIHAFKGCTSLKKVVLKPGITDLGTWTFEGCTSLKYVQLPTSGTGHIGEGLFYGCSGLEFITIPANITEFYDNVFNGCSNLMSIYYLADNISFFQDTNNQFTGTPGEMRMYTKLTPKETIAGVVWGSRFGENRKPYVEYEIPYTPAKQYTTFCRDFDVDFSAATGLKAGVALSSTLDGEGKLTFTVKSSVPAGTGVLLKKLDSGEFKLKIAESAPDAVGGNLMKGVIYDTQIPQIDGSNTNFVLSNGTFKEVNSSGNTIPAGKAYLQLPTPSSSARDISFSFDDEPTGINKVQGVEQKDDSYYNLQGQRVSQPMKGLYIINGKKVVVK